MEAGFHKRRSPIRCYLTAAILTAAAILLVLSARGLLDGTGRLSRTSLPGALSLQAPQAGQLIVYSEGESSPGFSARQLHVSGPSGDTVQVRSYSGELRYDNDGHVGSAIATFTAPMAGHYVVSTPAAHSGARLAVGADVGTSTMLADAAVLGSCILMLAAVLATAIGAARHHRAWRREKVTPSIPQLRPSAG